ncbi:LOW QUALITY PROTEIN: Protein CBG10357 [Caenorhabditis briggsae]|uniref:Protein CBG10357 n=1 Tax=Caenorhabditis briggsae TaxID=6238 RepID=A8XB11_CAEBR|nr:LOW QUALITY PROTEIN: Protein CBG10357 [Caenorhabditis briggsae]CAP29791.1 Protein CBG10357 [Caenorhabditis briggsae]
MISFENWKSMLIYSQWIGGTLGVIFNLFLILLIIYRSPQHLGVYKYLMMYISIVQTVFSILDVISKSITFSYGSVFMGFRYFKHSNIGRAQGFHLLSVHGGTFGAIISLFGVHFVYRYGVVDLAFRKRFLSGWKLVLIFLTPILAFIWWTSVVLLCFGPSSESDSLMRISLLQGCDTRIEDISYFIVQYHSLSEFNQLSPVWSTFFGMACIWIITSSSIFCVVYFGIKCYVKITKALKNSKMSSFYTKSIQHQLFVALVFQTLIPLILMYGPAGILFSCPMLNIEVGVWSSFVSATIVIYPAVDPLPTMFIVESYRKTILCK